MARKRDKLEVIHDILNIIINKGNSIKPTPLLRFSNLSTKSFNEYYEELIQKEFIKEIINKKNRKHITLSDKGFKFLEKYETIKNFIQEFEL